MTMTIWEKIKKFLWTCWESFPWPEVIGLMIATVTAGLICRFFLL